MIPAEHHPAPRARAEAPGSNQSSEQHLREWVEQVHRQTIKDCPPRPQSPERPTVHFTELPPAAPGSPLEHEWEYYRRVVGSLLTAGHEGRWVLIKDNVLLGPWDTYAEARAVAIQHYFLEPVLIRQILTREPVLRGPFLSLPCQA